MMGVESPMVKEAGVLLSVSPPTDAGRGDASKAACVLGEYHSFCKIWMRSLRKHRCYPLPCDHLGIPGWPMPKAQMAGAVLELKHSRCLSGHEKCHLVPTACSSHPQLLHLEFVLGGMCHLFAGCVQGLPGPEEPELLIWRVEMGMALCGPRQPLLSLRCPLATPKNPQ